MPRRATSSPPKPKRGFNLSSTGPHGLLNKDVTYVFGPGEPPPNFVSPTTSPAAWVWYWASAKVYEDPEDPRLPPFRGGADWEFLAGGRRNRLGAAADFIYYNPGETIGIRVQTDRFHESAGPVQQAFDKAQLMQLSKWMTMRNVYEQAFIGDRTGEAACRMLVRTLGGRKNIQPSRAGTYRRARVGNT